MRKTGCWAATVAVLCAFAGHASSASAALPGKNGKIAFDSPIVLNAQGDRDAQVFVVDPDGSDVTQLTHVAPGFAHEEHSSPAWSPDGSMLAIAYNDDLRVMKADGTARLRVFTSGRSDGSPRDWSPDGRRILFSRGFDIPDLFSVALDGTSLLQHTGSSVGESGGSWSPDGERILFGSAIFAPRPDLWTVTADGSEDPVPLTRTPTVSEEAPDWSPDGSRLTFMSNEDGDYEIYTMRVDGSDRFQVTQNTVTDAAPAWSPDGKRLVYLRLSPDSRYRPFVANSDGSGEFMLADLEVWSRLDWQPLPNRPPDCSGVGPSPGSLWPPHHRLVSVTLDGAHDPDGDAVTLRVTAVTSDEPVGARPDARSGETPDSVRLRAERAVRGDGRVYRIDFEAADGSGGTCSGTATVGVPRRQNTSAVDSAPPSYDAFGA